MIAHVAQAGEGRGRVVLQLTRSAPNAIALAAAIRVAQAFQSEIESLLLEDASLLDIAGLPFAREISFSGRHSRPLSPELVERQMRAAASALARQLRELADSADIPMHLTVVRGRDPVRALATACSEHGPWNVVALADPLTTNALSLQQLFDSVPGTTGLIVVGLTAKRCEGRVVALVEDISEFEPVLRTARRLLATSEAQTLTVLLLAESDAEAQSMDEQARLAIGDDESVEIIRARVHKDSPAMIAELLRRLHAGFLVGRFGGIVVPASGDMRPLAAVLECPLFLIR